MHKRKIIGIPTIELDTVDSTNDYAISLVSNSNPNAGTVIYAHHQSAGRGQIGSKWQSKAGENLLMSVILKPDFILPTQQFALNMVASLAIKDVLVALEIPAQIKWPNDIYVHDKKICGILIQCILAGKSIKYAVVGIGLNVNQVEFGDLAKATSIIIESKSQHLAQIKSLVCAALQKRYTELETEGWPHIESLYLQDMYRMHSTYDYRIKGQTVQGIIRGIDASGALQIEHDGQVHSYAMKEVAYI